MKQFILVAAFFVVPLELSLADDALFTAQGSMAGELTSKGVLLQTRLTTVSGPALDADGEVPGAAGIACFEYGKTADFRDAQRTGWTKAVPESDFIVRAQLTNLQAGQLYYYRPVFGVDPEHARPGASGQFRTLLGKESDREVTFIVGSCMNYNKFMFGKEGKASGPVTATEEDKRLGYPSFAQMVDLKPDFFIGTGDIVYYDNILHGPAQSLPQLRKCWHEQFRFPRLIDFFSRTPTYWSKDDHDFRFDDSDNSGQRLPLPQTGIEIFREQMPIHPAGDKQSPTYRTHRVNKHLQIWLTEGRDHRSPNKMSDGPDKSLWGKEQRDWLQRTLKESDADWKILISPTPMVGPDDITKTDNHTNLGGFRHEANEFFAWLGEHHITGFLTICGDRHWQYHSIHPSGIEEFACGALNDENSRVGVAPGSKKGTDPDALVKQPYTYPEPTGGFLRVRVSPNDGGRAKLEIQHRDDTGKVLNAVTKVPGVSEARSEHWPQFRGPTGLGYSKETNLPLHWGGKNDENVLWNVALVGEGHASPIVWNDRVFVCTARWPEAVTDRTKVIPEHHVLCYSTRDGERLWDVIVPPGPWLRTDFRSGPGGGYAGPTPATDGERVYCVFGSSVIAAIDFNGRILWRNEIKPHTFDVTIGSSPVLFRDTLLMLCAMANKSDSRIIAYNKSDGSVKWEVPLPNAGFAHSTPLRIDLHGKPQLIVAASGMKESDEGIQSFDPTNGQRIWWCRGAGEAASPAFGSGIIYCDNGRNGPGVAIDPTGEGDVTNTHTKWKQKQVPEGIGSPIIVGDYVYRLHAPNVLKCWRVSDGQETFASRLEGITSTWASPIADGNGHLFFASAGKSYVLESGPAFKVLAANDLSDPNHASPAVAAGRMYLVGTRKIYCIGE